MNRVLLYVHFNKNEKLSEHVVYQLRKIKPLFSKLVIISNSAVAPSDKIRLAGLYDVFIQRKNVGYDFAAWRDGLSHLGWDELGKYDSVTIMNDTCFGPIYPLDSMYEQMEGKKADFWGVTNHAATRVGMPGTNEAVPYHIQSYLEVFSKKVVKSEVFQSFWEGVKDHADVQKVIQEYETQLTRVLDKSGFTHKVLFDTASYSKKHNIIDLQNYSEGYPIALLKSEVPLLKIKSFLHTPATDIFREVKKTNYPVNLIINHLKDSNIATITRRNNKAKMKRVIKRGVGLLRKSDTIRKIAKRNPRLVSLAKKTSKRLFGDAPIIQSASKPERKSELLFYETYNPDLAVNFAEHNNILQSNKIYGYESESKSFYKRADNDPRIVAIYLPQFHPFKENNEAWGTGFTEWSNVASSVPRFVGQQQPVLPSDLGFYDLRLPEVIKQQIDLAKKYGIYGFQFYYYWFSGKKVMELPINTMLKNKEWDFNFSICWANENWTRKWDGGDNDIIFEQKNNPDDPLKFIEDVAHILNDPRYIHENGKPILTVYRIDLLDDPNRYADVWRKYFKDNYGKELWLVGCTNFKNFEPHDFGFDATMDLTPTGSSNVELKPWVDDRKFLTQEFTNGKLLDTRWTGHVLDYRFIAKKEIENLTNNPNVYKTVSPSWSNEARRKGIDGVTFYNSSPELFRNWLDEIFKHELNEKKVKSPIVFINAWNEWAESAMIEPSTHLGHNSLLRIAETLSKYSGDKSNGLSFPSFGFKYSKQAKLAVVIHLFYPNMWDILSEKLKNINIPFDLYISVPVAYKNIDIEKISKYHKNTNIVTVPNRGRDVLPFLTIVNRLRTLNNYKYVLKLHSKKSLHREDGGLWLKDVLNKLTPQDTTKIISTLSKKSTGAIGPEGHIVSLSRHLGSNEAAIKKLLLKITDGNTKKYLRDKPKYPFIGSTMFWARLDLLDPLLDAYLMPSDFEPETGQIDGTSAHALERIMGKTLHDISNKTMYTVDTDGLVSKVDDADYDAKYNFAP